MRSILRDKECPKEQNGRVSHSLAIVPRPANSGTAIQPCAIEKMLPTSTDDAWQTGRDLVGINGSDSECPGIAATLLRCQNGDRTTNPEIVLPETIMVDAVAGSIAAQ